MEDTLPTDIETMFLPPCGWCDYTKSVHHLCEVHWAEQVIARADHHFKGCSLARQLYSDNQLLRGGGMLNMHGIPCNRLYNLVKLFQFQQEKD